MKAILMSVRSKWCALMMNGNKKVEVRKGTALYKAIQKIIDEYGYADIYVYCTKGGGLLGRILKKWTVFKPSKWVTSRFNGKVIFKFRCYKVEEIRPNKDLSIMDSRSKELIRYANLSLFEGCEYLKWNIGCAIHISDLEIFDKPKELSEFYSPYANKCLVLDDTIEDIKKDNFYRGDYFDLRIIKAPQSWCYVEVEQ